MFFNLSKKRMQYLIYITVREFWNVSATGLCLCTTSVLYTYFEIECIICFAASLFDKNVKTYIFNLKIKHDISY